MYKILKNELIGHNIYLLEVEAPLVVRNCLPGQFVIVMALENSERIPLTIYDYNRDTNVLKMVYQVVGASTDELTHMNEELFSVVGPLGNPSEIVLHADDFKGKDILLVGGGVGIAPVLPQAKFLKEHGVNVDIIYGVKTSNLVILEDEIRSVDSNAIITTDDGSYGMKGLVTDAIKLKGKKYEHCIVIGPLVMMKAVTLLTKELNIPTTVSMNPIMVDGTGMCGACRLSVDGKVKFACVDGPEFDGFKVDFDAALKRMKIYQTEEGRMRLKLEEGDTHHGGCGNCE